MRHAVCLLLDGENRQQRAAKGSSKYGLLLHLPNYFVTVRQKPHAPNRSRVKRAFLSKYRHSLEGGFISSLSAGWPPDGGYTISGLDAARRF
jgi:hypothetical protein